MGAHRCGTVRTVRVVVHAVVSVPLHSQYAVKAVSAMVQAPDSAIVTRCCGSTAGKVSSQSNI